MDGNSEKLGQGSNSLEGNVNLSDVNTEVPNPVPESPNMNVSNPVPENSNLNVPNPVPEDSNMIESAPHWQQPKPKKISFFQVIGWLIMALIGVGALLVFLNREWVHDYLRGRDYQPTSEMQRIREDLALTERGEFLFNAAQPELNDRDDFNAHCRDGASTEIAVLGCYTNSNIYIYNIEEEELDGIRELTAAHELLHAVFARMTEAEKNEFREILEQVYEDNEDILKRDLDTYDSGERFEEMYVRVGTEVADLPEALEKHYGEIFKDQDKIVGFYNQYIKVFRKIESDMEALKQEMEGLEASIEAKKAEYSQYLNEVNARVDEFNACADTAGCFESEAVFEARRAVLISEQQELEGLYNEINGLVDQYNLKVSEYNENVLHNDKLNQIVNSSEELEEIE